MVTGEYSRGASGFWIENGELTYPVSEVTIASNLKDMFLQHGPGQRPRPQFRHRRADAADRGHDACRQLNARSRPADDLALIREAAREAGRIALRLLQAEPGSLDEGRHLAGQRGRLRGRPLPEGDADWRRGRTMAGCRRRRPTAPAGLPPAAPSSSIRSTARAPSSTAARPGASASPWSKTGIRSPACSTARRPARSSAASAGSGACKNGAALAVGAPREPALIGGPKPMLDARTAVSAARASSARTIFPRSPTASPWWPRARSTRPSSSPTRMTGIWRPPT